MLARCSKTTKVSKTTSQATNSNAAKRFSYATCVYNPDMLEFLVGKVGAGHVVLGTDYPVFLKEDDPLGFIRKTRGLSAKDRDGILWRNAARLLKLKV